MKTELGINPIQVSFTIPVLNWKIGDDKNQYQTLTLQKQSDRDIINQAIKDQKEITQESDSQGRYLAIGKAPNRGESDHRTKIYFDNNSFTIDQLRADPTLASNSLSSNGLMNNLSEATIKATMQLGGFDKDGRLTLLYDPTAKGQELDPGKAQTIKGLTIDAFESSINRFGAGVFITPGQAQDQEVIKIVTNQAKLNGEIVTLSGHSAGGLRNYLTLLNSSPNQYLDNNGNPMLQTIFYGTPASKIDVNQAAQNSGAIILQNRNNSGDPIGYVIGTNGDVVDAISGAGHLFHLFEPKVPFTNTKLESPHSNYYCQGSHCNFNINLNFNQNPLLATPSKTNSDLR